MMELDAILVVENGANDNVTRMLVQFGFPAVYVSDMRQALTRVSHDRFRAAIVTPTAQVDALEFVLSARDRQHDLPVIIVNPSRDLPERKALERLEDVFILENPARNLIATVEEVVHYRSR